MFEIIENRSITGLYIHIPFCTSKCGYCDFYSFVPSGRSVIDEFLVCLEMELKRLPQSFLPSTIFVGGGTPTALNVNQLRFLMGMLHDHINLSSIREFTSEANPGSLNEEKLHTLLDGGVSRLSIGVQSFNTDALDVLDRKHSPNDAVQAVALARSCGFKNVSIDLIQSIPGMDCSLALDDVQQAVALEPDHISYYNLIYEPGTPMTAQRDAGELPQFDEDEEADCYFSVKKELESAGYGQYEISNFARDKKFSLHNMLYWKNCEYFGVGPSAHSHWGGARFGNVRDLKLYCERLKSDDKPFDEMERLESDAKAREALVMELRLIEGVKITTFEQKVGFKLNELCGETIDELMDVELLEMNDGYLRLTEKALFVSNYVFSELV